MRHHQLAISEIEECLDDAAARRGALAHRFGIKPSRMAQGQSIGAGVLCRP